MAQHDWNIVEGQVQQFGSTFKKMARDKKLRSENNISPITTGKERYKKTDATEMKTCLRIVVFSLVPCTLSARM